MNVFVTGGNGFIGSNVVRVLVEEGHEVRCLVRESSDVSRLEGLRWERFVGDVRDRESMLEGSRDCDAIVHLASPSSWDAINSPHMKEIVEGGTRNILEASREHGGLRVVYCSSVIAVNGTDEPELIDEDAEFTLQLTRKMVYARSKHAAEQIAEEYFEKHDVPVVTVNPVEVYGPHDTGMVTAGNLVDFAKSYPVLITTGGTSVAHVEDIAFGIVRAMERGRPGHRYILGGENLTHRQLAETTLSILGKKAPIVSVPRPILQTLTNVGQAMRIPLPYNPHVIPYAVKYWFVDNKKARQELGVEFRPPEDVLRPTLEWLRTEGHIT